MSHRSWPWKKKTSEKVIAATDSVNASLPNLARNQADEDDSKKVKYVQITEESYIHLTELEDQVKALNEKLSAALSEITTKDNLVKQHTKVAEEAVSGWEKAEEEAIALKGQLESVLLLKLTAEDKASHLDGALKECMRQIRNVKDESEQKLHDVVFAKTKQWEKVKEEFEAKIVNLNQELLRASAENDALSRSLQERSTLLMKISDEKSQAEAHIEVLKSNMQSCEKEISSLKYELNIVSKELEIRNEEKNMSLRSAEAANKQHLEGVKKIAKLEAECQRLRGLVRKKLPGPAALAQMKLEVENLGRDYGEPRVRRSPVKNSGQHLVSPSDFPLENVQCKENEFLTARLMAMEEETKMLKEALSKRNSELQASRNMCAKTTSKLRSLEAQLQTVNQQQTPGKMNLIIPLEASLSQNASNPPSLSSMSEDGIDEEASVADSSVTIPSSELSQFKKDKNRRKSSRNGSSSHLELMEDFLEMERLACLSMEPNGVASVTENCPNQIIGKGDCALAVEGALSGMTNGEAPDPTSNENDSDGQLVRTQSLLEKLQSRIALAFENQTKDPDCSIIMEEIRRVVQDILEDLPQNSVNCVFEKTMDNRSSSPCYTKPCIESKQSFDQKLDKAMSEIQEFVGLLRNEATKVEGWGNADSGLSQKIDELFISIDRVSSSQMNLADFIIELSCILGGARELGINAVGIKGNEAEVNSSDCVDKVTLLENVVQPDQSKERISSDCTLTSHSTLDSKILQEGRLAPRVELNAGSFRYNLDEFEQLKQLKDNMLIELARCNESLEQKKFQLEEKEKLLVELRSQLATSQKSNSLGETQLKCMVESYKLLETRAEDLEAEINLLRIRTENLDTELQEEKCRHDDVSAKCRDMELKCKDLEIKCKELEASCKDYETRCKDLEEQIQRTEKDSMCSSSAPDPDRIKQERDIAAAAEKLAECQETIFLLGKQLTALRSPNDPVGPSYKESRQMSIDFQENEPSPSGLNSRNARSEDFDRGGLENIASIMQRTGSESPLDLYSASMSPDTELSVMPASPRNSKHPTHRATRSSSSSSSMILTPEKHGRGFSRFFSRGKGAAK